MHGAEAGRDAGDARERARGHRHEGEKQRGQGAIHREQQHHDERGADRGEPYDLALDDGARGDREHRRSAHQEPQRAALAFRERGQHGRKRAPDGFACRLLRIRIRSRRPCLHEQQRARAVGRAPHALGGMRSLPGSEGVDDPEQLAGRIAREQGLDEEPLGRGQPVEGVADRGAQSLCREALPGDVCAQQVTMAKQKLPIALEPRGIPVVDGDEGRIGRKKPREPCRPPRSRACIRTLERHDDEVRRRALAQLLDEEALLRAGGARQKRREVCDVGRARNDHHSDEHQQHPDQGGGTGRAPHGGISGPMVRTERSPSFCRISTVRIASRAPSMRMSFTARARVESAGVSRSVQ